MSGTVDPVPQPPCPACGGDGTNARELAALADKYPDFHPVSVSPCSVCAA